jgi:hypothetical protein
MAAYASLDEAFGGSYGKKGTIKEEDKTYNSATRRTESALEQHSKVIGELTKTLPIASRDSDETDNYAPAMISGSRSGTNQIEPFSVRDYKLPTIPGTAGFAYSPPEPTSDRRNGYDTRVEKLLRRMEHDGAGGETSTHDLLLYIFTGVFMLFVLDTFVHIGKRSK